MNALLRSPAYFASPDDADRLERRMDALRDDPAKVAEADEWWSGTLDGSQYSAIESALADLHEVNAADLLGSDVLDRLYRLAKVCNALRSDALRRMAETQAASDAADAAEARDEWMRENAR